MLLAATTVFANNDSLLNAPVKIRLFPEVSGDSEPISPILAEPSQDAKSWWVELSLVFMVDWLEGDDATGGATTTTSYAHAYKPGMGAGFQLGLNHIWGPKSDWFQYSLMLRPYVGGSLHLFEGEDADNPLPGGGQAKFTDLTITTLHGGIMFGAGTMPDGSGPGIFAYLNVQAGMAIMSGVDVRAPNSFAGEVGFTDDSSSIYYAASIGVRVMLGGLTFNVEGGARNFGKPERNSTLDPLPSSEDPIMTWFMMFGITLEF
jgi:hypothetical protein